MYKLFRKYKWIYQLIPESKKIFAFNFLLSILSNLFTIAAPLIFSLIIDSIFIQRNFGSFFRYIILYSIIYFICLFLSVATQKWDLYVTKVFTNKLKMVLYNKVISLKASELLKLNTGDVIITIKNVDSVYSFLNVFVSCIISYINLLVLFIITASICYEVAIIIFTLSILTILLSDLFKKKFSVLKKSYREDYGKYSSWFIEVLNGMKDIRINNAEEYIINRFSDYVLKLLNSKEKARFLEIRAERLNGFFSTIFTIIFWIVSALFVVIGKITIGLYMALEKYYNMVIEKINFIRSTNISYHNFKPDLDKISEILKMSDEDLTAGELVNISHRPINIDKISFQYTPDVDVLQEVSLQINNGEFVALVGANGEGKSTFLDLLIRFFDPQTGSIYIGETNLADIPVLTLRQQIGFIQQDTIIFEGTLAENLKLYSPTATESEMWLALKKCEMFETVRSWEEGLKTDLLRGDRLSVGQKQRIAFARILLKNSSIILMDEPTSALDSETERQLISEVKKIFANKIVVMVSHRHTAVKGADRIYVLHQGKIIVQAQMLI